MADKQQDRMLSREELEALAGELLARAAQADLVGCVNLELAADALSDERVAAVLQASAPSRRR